MEVVARGRTVGHDHVDVGQLLHVKLFLLWWEVLRIITGKSISFNIIDLSTISYLHICKNLSGLAELCSGPIPSIPWGSSITRPLCLTHLLCPLAMNWSMMHWAVLAKSPNWPSHSTRALGLVMEYPNSKPNTPYSDKELLHTE